MAFEIIHRSYDEASKTGHVTAFDQESGRSINVQFPCYPTPVQAGGPAGASLESELLKQAKTALTQALEDFDGFRR